ncbi:MULTISPECIES: Crp/Fnr family transcriptional regulator [unclassified Sphingomonas]|uniref:Crp/Fnr family transcriptional regulator n=1 Tax=unclassified Sphingomonas TaxID=196159 RepID=UPI000E101FC8|nr:MULTISPECIES: Crp/Fnr family transcriptional regulator [unclassified Sphingomonas]AXJ96807.1 Crp/Fnr family transcriptional regulator [Sphingomonas sp. FARSPH]
MPNPLIARLGRYVRLSPEERALVERAVAGPDILVRQRRDLIREGDPPRGASLILEGWAFRYKTLEDGRRQIVALHLPGDLCDLHGYILNEMDHSVGALTNVRYVEIGRNRIEELATHSPRLTHAFWWDTLTKSAILREWIVNLGQRDALERLAHLFCELFYRLRAVGLAEGNRCDIPLTQTDLAETTGMTPVHVNRMVQELRARGLIRWKSGVFEALDLDGLCEVAMFNAGYLHLDQEGRTLDADD